MTRPSDPPVDEPRTSDEEPAPGGAEHTEIPTTPGVRVIFNRHRAP